MSKWRFAKLSRDMMKTKPIKVNHIRFEDIDSDRYIAIQFSESEDGNGVLEIRSHPFGLRIYPCSSNVVRMSVKDDHYDR